MADALASSPFGLLPTELIRHVVGQLDREAVFTLSLVCKTLRCHATPLAFIKIPIWLEEQSLQSLLNVGHDPQLRQAVHAVSFSMDQFYDVDFGVFIHPGLDQSPDANGYCYARSAAWILYREYLRKQDALIESKNALRMMTESFASFPALSKIEIIATQPDCPSFNEGMRILKRERLLLRQMLTVPDDRLLFPRGGQQLPLLIEALAAAKKSIEHLSLQMWCNNMNSSGFLNPFTSSVRALAYPAMAELKTFQLDLEPLPPDILQNLNGLPEETSLTTILRAATKLRSLTVFLSAYSDECWRDYIRITRFGRLEHLHIKNAGLHEADFVSFLRESCQGLKRLSLHSAMVAESSWDLIFETIRSLPSLEEVDLHYLWHDSAGRDFWALKDMDKQPLYDYLLKRRPDNPWEAMCKARWDGFCEENTRSEESEDQTYTWTVERQDEEQRLD